MWSSLNTLGKAAVGGLVAIEGAQLAGDLQNNGGTPKAEIVQGFLCNARLWLVVGAVGVFVYVWGRK